MKTVVYLLVLFAFSFLLIPHTALGADDITAVSVENGNDDAVTPENNGADIPLDALSCSAPQPDYEASAIPTILSIQIDLENEADNDAVPELLGYLESADKFMAFYATPDFAEKYPETVKKIHEKKQALGLLITEDLTKLSYDEQFQLIFESRGKIEKIIGSEFRLKDAKTKNLQSNKDTYSALRKLNITSLTGIFDDPDLCAVGKDNPGAVCSYCQLVNGKIDHVYPTVYGFVIIPIATVSDGIPLSDNFFESKEKNFFDGVIAKYDETHATPEHENARYISVSVHASSADREALSRIIEHVNASEGFTKPIDSETFLNPGNDISSMAITEYPDPICPDQNIKVKFQYTSTRYCPTYYFIIYGKYPSETAWKELWRNSYYHTTGTYTREANLPNDGKGIPEPSEIAKNDPTYTILLRGEDCVAAQQPCWPDINHGAQKEDTKNIKIPKLTPEVKGNSPYIGLQQYEVPYKNKVFRRGSDKTIPRIEVEVKNADKIPDGGEFVIDLYKNKTLKYPAEQKARRLVAPFINKLNNKLYEGKWDDWKSSLWAKIPDDILVGAYKAQAKVLKDGKELCPSDNVTFWLIFDKPKSLTADEEKAYLYDDGGTRDTRGVHYSGNYGINGGSLFGSEKLFTYNEFSETVFKLITVATDGDKKESDAADNLWNMVYNFIKYTTPYSPANVENMYTHFSEQEAVDAAGGTNIENIGGHCLDYANALAASMRSIGIPARAATGARAPTPGGGEWNYHEWTEVYFNTPLGGGTDHWYIYDSTPDPVQRKDKRSAWGDGKGSLEVPVGNTTWDVNGGKLKYYPPPKENITRDNTQANDAMFEKCEKGNYARDRCTYTPFAPQQQQNISFSIILDKDFYRTGDVIHANISIFNQEDSEIHLSTESGFEKIADGSREAANHTFNPFFSIIENVTIPPGETIYLYRNVTVYDTLYPYFIYRAFIVITNNTGIRQTAKFDVLPAYDVNLTIPETLYNESLHVNLTFTNKVDFDVSNIVLNLTIPSNYNTSNPLGIELPTLLVNGTQSYSWILNPNEIIFNPFADLHFTITSSNGGNETIDEYFRLILSQNIDIITNSVKMLHNKNEPFTPQTKEISFFVQNIGDLNATDVYVNLTLPENVTASDMSWYFGVVEGKEEIELRTNITTYTNQSFEISVFAYGNEDNESAVIPVFFEYVLSFADTFANDTYVNMTLSENITIVNGNIELIENATSGVAYSLPINVNTDFWMQFSWNETLNSYTIMSVTDNGDDFENWTTIANSEDISFLDYTKPLYWRYELFSNTTSPQLHDIEILYSEKDPTYAAFTDQYTDYGQDTDYDGKYNYLVISIGVNVTAAGNYSLEGYLFDNESNLVASTFNYSYRSTGVSNISLRFDGVQLYHYGYNGSYYLNLIQIYDSGYSQMDYRTNAYITPQYNYTQFQKPSLMYGVVSANQTPVTNLMLSVVGPVTENPITDENGSYVTEELAAGSYTIYVYPPGELNLMKTLTSTSLAPGEEKSVNFTLAQSGSVAGNVTNATGAPVSEYIYEDVFEPPYYATDENGYYVVPYLSAGTRRIRISSGTWWLKVEGEYLTQGQYFDMDVILGNTSRLDFTQAPPLSAECGPVPANNCYIIQNTTFVQGNYYLPLGILINASNIALDCNNSVIRGYNFIGNGITINNKQNVTIKNCDVRKFDNGLYASQSSNINLENMRFVNNTIGSYLYQSGYSSVFDSAYNGNKNNGIYLYYSPFTMLENVTVTNTTTNNAGIYVYSSNNNTILNTTADFNYYGVQIYYSNDNRIINSTLRYNSLYGIYLQSDDYTLISHNYFNNSNKDTWITSDSDYNRVEGNEFLGGGVHDESFTTDYCSGDANFYRPGAEEPFGDQLCDCVDNDFDGTYGYNNETCIVGNDCDDNNSYIIGVVDDTYVNHDVTVCSGNYGIRDVAGNGVFIFNASSAILDCSGASINGTDSGYGIYSNNKGNIGIRNCIIRDYSYGVYLYSVDNSTIENSTIISSPSYGLYIFYGSNNAVLNTTLAGNYYGLYLFYSPRSRLSSINSSSNYYGLYFYSPDSMLSDNIIDKNTYGIYITSYNNNTIARNAITSNTYRGLYVDSDYNNISTNFFNNTGVYDLEFPSGADYNTIGGNSFYGRGVLDNGFGNSYCADPNYYAPGAEEPWNDQICGCTDADNDRTYAYNNETCPVGNDCNDADQTIIGVIDDIYVNYNVTVCPGSYSVNDRYDNGVFIFNASNAALDCNGASINGTESGRGIYSNSRANTRIKNCNIRDYYYGIYQYSCDKAVVENSNLTSNYYGVYMYSCNNATVMDNNLNESSGYGLYIYESNYNTITGNNIDKNYYGAYIYYSDFNAFSSNNVIENSYYGIYVYYSSDNNIFLYNNVLNTTYYDGIYVYYSQNNLFSYNNIYGNTRYNIYNEQEYNVSAENNWWGTNNETQIAAKIYDQDDYSYYGKVDYTPWLNSPFSLVFVSEIQCEKSGVWQDCSNVLYSDTLTRVRANVTSFLGNVTYGIFTLINVPDNANFFQGNTSVFEDSWLIFDNPDMLIQDSGDWQLLVQAFDDTGFSGSGVKTWLVPWGHLEAALIDPTGDIDVKTYREFNFSSSVTCIGGECGNVSATLDPEQEQQISFSLDAANCYSYDRFACTEGDFYIYSPYPTDTLTCTFTDPLGPDFVVTQITVDHVGFNTNCDAETRFYVDGTLVGNNVETSCTCAPGDRFGPITSQMFEEGWPEYAYDSLNNFTAVTDYAAVFDDDSPFFNITLTYIRTGKGAIPMNNGTPFYTLDNNPRMPEYLACLQDMRAGDACEQTWRVIPTATNGTYEFFTIYDAVQYPIASNTTPKINVSVFETATIIHSVECNVNDNWEACTNIAYNDVVSSVRINCTNDEVGIDYASMKLENTEDNTILAQGSTPNLTDGYYVIDVDDLTIQDSGTFDLEASCVDNDGAPKIDIITWLVPWGHLEAALIDPTGDIDVKTYREFNFSSSVTCIGGECGNVSATLDPQGINYTVLNATKAIWAYIYGSDIYSLYAGEAYGELIISYIEFNLSQLPQNLRIINSSLVLTTSYLYGTVPELGTYKILEPWTEDTIYDIYTGPAYAENYEGTNTPVDYYVTYGWDVTNMAKEWLAATPNYGIALTKTSLPSEYDNYAGFYSRFDFPYNPKLVIYYNLGKGVVPMGSGEPFYTYDQNPRYPQNLSCLQDMRAGNACEQTWRVIPTATNGTYEFFTIYDAMQYPVASNTTPKINVSVFETATIIHSVECDVNDNWEACSNIAYSDVVSSARINCTNDEVGIDYASMKLENTEDNTILAQGSTPNLTDGYYVIDVDDLTIQDSGTFDLEASCIDNAGTPKVDIMTWLVPWGGLEPYLIAPVNATEVHQNKTFTFSSGVTCTGGECGNVSATLDPEQEQQISFSLDAANCFTPYRFICAPDDFYIDTYGNGDTLFCTFADTLGPDFVVTQITVDHVGFNTNCYTETRFYVDGTLVGNNTETSCICDPGDRFGPITSQMFEEGWPSYAYDGLNNFTAVTTNAAVFDDDPPFFNITLTYIRTGKGIIPMNSGEPFYTYDQNPVYPQNLSCLENMKDGNICEQSWLVNATGEINSTWEFFTIYEPLVYADVGENETATVNITIIAPIEINDTEAPIITLISPPENFTETSSNTILFEYSAYDELSDIVECSLLINGIINQTDYAIQENVTQNFTQYLENGIYDWQISCKDTFDNEGFSEIRTLIVNVPLPNNPPVMDATGNKFVDEGDTLIIDVNATDPDNDTLTYYTNAGDVLPSYFTFNESTGLFTWMPTFDDAGEYNVTFNVTDGIDWDEETIIITVNDVNRPPELDIIGNREINENETLIIDVNATDPDNDVLTYYTNADEVLPSPFVFNETTGMFEWTPTLDDAGIYNVTFNVTDGELWDEETITITVNDVILNQPPILELIGDQQINEQETLIIDLEASDPDNDTLTFYTNAGEVLPSTFTFDSVTGLLEWTPTYFDSGEYNVTFNVTDGIDWDSETITITVIDVPLDVELNNPYVSTLSNFTPNSTIYVEFDAFNNENVTLYNVSLKLDTNSSDPDIEFRIPIFRPYQEINFILHWNYSQPGMYQPFAFIDYAEELQEYNENNNIVGFGIMNINAPLPLTGVKKGPVNKI